MAQQEHLWVSYARVSALRVVYLVAGVVLLLGECPGDVCAKFSCIKTIIQCSSANSKRPSSLILAQKTIHFSNGASGALVGELGARWHVRAWFLA